MIKQLATLTFLFAASSAHADGYSTHTGIVVDVKPVYSYDQMPVRQEQCAEVQVPVYGNQPGSTGDVLAGAIIGGAIGNQFGSGSGQDAMTVLGAIVGADVAGRGGNQVVGYRYEWQCQIVETYQEQKFFHHYEVTYKNNGKYYRVNTDEMFEIGERIKVSR